MRSPRTKLLSLSVVTAVALAAAAPSQTRYWDPVFPQVTVVPNIVYGQAVSAYTGQTVTLLLDLYLPAGDQETSRPAVVMVHGGNWCRGSRSDQVWVRFGNDFASRGYVAASISYRLAPSCGQVSYAISPLEAIDDTKAAIRFLRRHAVKYGIDPARIAGIGHSAGAYSVNGAAYFDLPGSSGNPGYPHKLDVLCEVSGGMPGYLDTIDPDEAPICVVHGDQDPTVPFQQAVNLVNRCKKVGVPVEFHRLAGKGHELLSTDYDNIRDWSLAWFHRHLKLTQKAGLGAVEGYASPGSLTLVAAGPASMDGVLLVSARTASVGFGAWGVLRLDMGMGYDASLVDLSHLPAVATQPLKFTVPAGLSGVDVHWQAFLVQPNPLNPRLFTPYSFTNLVTTRF